MASIFKQKYTAKDKNGNKITKQSKFWYIDYKGADGIRKRVKGFKDKAATTQYAAKLEREAELALFQKKFAKLLRLHRLLPGRGGFHRCSAQTNTLALIPDVSWIARCPWHGSTCTLCHPVTQISSPNRRL